MRTGPLHVATDCGDARLAGTTWEPFVTERIYTITPPINSAMHKTRSPLPIAMTLQLKECHRLRSRLSKENTTPDLHPRRGVLLCEL